MLPSLLGVLAGTDPAGQPAEALAEALRMLEQADAVGAAARGRLLEVFDAQDGHLADGQRSTRTWLVHCTRVTRGQASEYQAVQALAREHAVLLAALAEGDVLTKSVALQLAQWTRPIPADYRAKAEEILVAAARAGAGLRALAAICAEIRYRTAQPDPDDENDRHLDRGVSFDTTLDGAGVLHGDLTPQCARDGPGRAGRPVRPGGGRGPADPAAAVPRRAGRGDAAAAGLGPAPEAGRAAGQGPGPHLLRRARPTGTPGRRCKTRGSASTGPGGPRTARRRRSATGDGGAWLEGDAARAIACDAMIVPVVTGDIDPAAVEDLILLCVRYHRLRAGAPGPADAPGSSDIPDRAGIPDGTGDVAVPAGLTGSAARQAGQAARWPRPWPSWSTRSWARSSRSSPAPAGPRRSCAATCWARA